MVKTNKRAIVLVVALWAVLGGVLFKNVTDIREEATLERISDTQSIIRTQAQDLLGRLASDIFWRRHWEREAAKATQHAD